MDDWETEDWEAFTPAPEQPQTVAPEPEFDEFSEFAQADTSAQKVKAEVMSDEFLLELARLKLQDRQISIQLRELQNSFETNKKWKADAIQQKGKKRIEKKESKTQNRQADTQRKLDDYKEYIRDLVAKQTQAATTLLEKKFKDDKEALLAQQQTAKEQRLAFREKAAGREKEIEEAVDEILAEYDHFVNSISFRMKPAEKKLTRVSNDFIESLFTQEFQNKSMENIFCAPEYPVLTSKYHHIVKNLAESSKVLNTNHILAEKFFWNTSPKASLENDDDEKNPATQATWMEKYAFSLNMDSFLDASTDFSQKIHVAYRVLDQLEKEAAAASNEAGPAKKVKVNKKAKGKVKPVIAPLKKVTNYEKDVSNLGLLNFELRLETGKKIVLRILKDKNLTPAERKKISLNVLFTLISWCTQELNVNFSVQTSVWLFMLLSDVRSNFRNLESVQLRYINLTLQTLFPQGKKEVKVSRDKEIETTKKWVLLTPTPGLTLLKFLEDNGFEGENLSIQSFQLHHCGAFMLKDLNPRHISHPDISFTPDEWQYQLIHMINDDQSVLVVVPTSAGKTFSSFYVISRMLERMKLEKEKSLTKAERAATCLTARVVFVAPTLPLVNQMAADIYFRYGKERRCGIYTSEFKSNLKNAEILICTPDVFQMLLFSPSQQQWAKELLYVIFDEIHCIAEQNIDNQISPVVYTQVLSLVQCPFLALSATVDHPEKFQGWLSKLHGKTVHLIPGESEKIHRWTDLSKYQYEHPLSQESWTPSITDIKTKSQVTKLHPFSLVSDLSLHFIDDVELSPDESLQLFCAIKLCSDSKTVEKLEPEVYFASQNPFAHEAFEPIKRADSFRYQHELKALFKSFSEEMRKKVQVKLCHSEHLKRLEEKKKAIQELGLSESEPHSFQEIQAASEMKKSQEITVSAEKRKSADYIADNILELFFDLSEKKMLPAICFVFEREFCEDVVSSFLAKLEAAQPKIDKPKRQKDNSARVKDLAKTNEKEKEVEEGEEPTGKDFRGIKREMKELELVSLNSQIETIKDYRDTVHEDFTLLGCEDPFDSDIEWWLRRLLKKNQWRSSHHLIRGLMRGVAAYHAHLPKPYRDLVETLFRASKLRVIISTPVLSLGINMPCKTVIFPKDDPEKLTPGTFKQMAGRAGRRGFDHAGYTVFFDLDDSRIEQLLFSPLHELKSQSPIDLDTCLKMMILHNESEAESKASISNLLQRLMVVPMAEVNNPDFLPRVQVFIRASLEFFYQMKLVDSKGCPSGLSHMVSTIAGDELSLTIDRKVITVQVGTGNFALAYLIANDVFKEICAPFSPSVRKAAEEEARLQAAEEEKRFRVVRSEEEEKKRQEERKKKKEEAEKARKNLETEAKRKVLAILSYFLFVIPVESGTKCNRMTPIPEHAKAELEAFNKQVTQVYENAFATFEAAGFNYRFEPPTVTLHPESDLNSIINDFYRHKKNRIICEENNIDDYNSYTLLKKWNHFLKRLAEAMQRILKFSEGDPFCLCLIELQKDFDYDFYHIDAASY